jgi:hypothetical protein
MFKLISFSSSWFHCKAIRIIENCSLLIHQFPDFLVYLSQAGILNNQLIEKSFFAIPEKLEAPETSLCDWLVSAGFSMGLEGGKALLLGVGVGCCCSNLAKRVCRFSCKQLMVSK